MHDITAARKLASVLNNWLDELKQQGILIEYKESDDREKYLFTLCISKKSDLSLGKFTYYGNLFRNVFGEIRGIIATHSNMIFALRELQPGSFQKLNRNFKKFLDLLTLRIKQEFKQYNQFSISLNDDSTLKLDQTNFERISYQDLQYLRQLTGKEIISLSLQECNLGQLSSKKLKEVIEIIKISKAKKISLNSNQLNLLDRDHLSLLLTVLKNSALKEIELDDNKLNESFRLYSDLFINFLTNYHLLRLSLKDNNLDDVSIGVVAKYACIEKIELNYNNISDKGANLFHHNHFITSINVCLNSTTFLTNNYLTKKARENQKALQSFYETHFISLAVVIAQGARTPQNIFHKVPKEIIFFILTLIGYGLRDERAVQILCQLIIKNICNSKIGKLNWENKISVSNKTYQIFQTSTHIYDTQFSCYKKTFFVPAIDHKNDASSLVESTLLHLD